MKTRPTASPWSLLRQGELLISKSSLLTAPSRIGEQDIARTVRTFIGRLHQKYSLWLLGLISLLSVSGIAHSEPEVDLQTLQSPCKGDSSMQVSYAPNAREPGNTGSFADLLAKAKTHGSVRVIVHLTLDAWKPEGDLLNDQAVTAQRQAIAESQARLLSRMTSFDVSDIKQFTYVPQVAMKVSLAALQDLLSNPDVTGIWEDVWLAPGR
jgi:hypothetical protein